MARQPPDWIAHVFLARDGIDAGGRAFEAYDAFLPMLSHKQQRDDLRTLKRDNAARSVLFKQIKTLGDNFERGRITLLLDEELMQRLVRGYLIF